MIRTEGLTKKFGPNRGIFDLNLSLPESSIYGFVGHNGAGKTTAIKILCGLLKQDSGKAFIGDLEVCPKNFTKIKRMIGYMPDITGVYDQMSVWEFLDFYGAAFRIPPKERKERIEYTLDLTRASDMIDYQVSSLSRGMRQKVALAKTLLHDPQVLILDEPAGGLDPTARFEMRTTISKLKSLGKTILLSSHILPELSSCCDLVGIINKGKLVAQGTVKEISCLMHENLSLLLTVDAYLEETREILLQLPLVKDAVPTDTQQLLITYEGTREQASGLLRTLIEHNVPVRFFSESEEDLENVFLNITHEDEEAKNG